LKDRLLHFYRPQCVFTENNNEKNLQKYQLIKAEVQGEENCYSLYGHKHR